MKCVLFCALVCAASAMRVSPIEKVMTLMAELQQKIIKDADAEQKSYEEFANWCKDTSREKSNEIKQGNAGVEELSATIAKAESDDEVASTRIEEISGSISTDESDLKASALIRAREFSEFQASDKELRDTVSMLARAQSVLEKELGKNSFLQAPGADAQKMLTALSQIVEASGVATEDAEKLTALLQQSSDADESDGDDFAILAATDATASKSKSGGILETLADMQDKAEAQQSAGQKAEMESKANYEMLKMALTNKGRNEQKELDSAKKDKAASQETKATAEGELAITRKDLAEDRSTLEDTHHECTSKAADFEEEALSRKEELQALATAKKTLKEMTGEASEATYGFVQLGSSTAVAARSKTHMHMRTKSELAGFNAIKAVRALATKVHSPALMQFARRMSVAMHSSAASDPFAKVKDMILSMVDKLVKEAEEEAGEKAFCDKEMAETKASKADKEGEIEDQTTKMDKASADAAKLKEEVSTLSKELLALVQSQAEMDKMRMEQHAEFEVAAKDLEQGLKGIQMALKVLRDYYAKSDEESFAQTGSGSSVQQSEPSSGAGGGIIALLEIAEADFSKNLSEIQGIEESAVNEYKKMTEDNSITKVTKEQDVKYKTAEAKALDKAAADLENDRDGVQAELDAVLEYYEKLKPQCITKPESYEERKKRREQEIAGLKDALNILEGEAMA